MTTNYSSEQTTIYSSEQTTIYSREQLCSHLGIGDRALRTKIADGAVTQIDRGYYAIGQLEPQQWAHALLAIHPTWVLAGLSAYQFHQGLPLTFPLQFRAPLNKKARSNEKFQVTSHRTHVITQRGPTRVVPPIWAAWGARDEVRAHDLADFLEGYYSEREGKRNLEIDLSGMGNVPTDLQRYISTLSIGSDSRLERRFYRGLRRRNLEFEQNVMIGPYMFDFQSKRFKRLLIEIGAHKYHRDMSTNQGEVAFVNDSWKFNYAMLEDYVVLQFTARCIDEELDRCLDFIEDVIAVMEGGSPARRWGPPWKWHSWVQRNDRFRRVS